MRKKYSALFTGLWSILLAACLLFPLLGGSYYVRFISLLFIYVIIAVGYNLAAGFCGVTHFAAASMYGAGAYASAIAIARFGLPFAGGVVAGILAAGVVSLIISIPAFKVKGFYLTLVSMGVLEIVQRILIEWQPVTGGSVGFYLPGWTIFGISLDLHGRYYFILAIMVLILLFQRNLIKSQWGRDFKSIRDNEIAAGGIGVNYRICRVLGFLLSAAISGIAGALYASFSGYLSPDSFGFSFTVLVLLMVIVGGSGTLSGPVVGAAIATIIPEFFNSSPDLKQIIYGLLLIVLTQVLPGGVVGAVKKRFRQIDDTPYIAPEDTDTVFDLGAYQASPGSDDGEYILETHGLTRQFGGLTAVGDLDISIRRGSIHSLIGPNGAGKTTTVNMITGIDHPTSGTIVFNGGDISNINTWDLVHKGISRTYQHVRLFQGMSVIENVVMGARLTHRYNLASAIFRTPKMRRQEKAAFQEAMRYLQMIGLADKLNEEPSSMSSGQQKLLELARALVMKPKLLVLDEPCAGLTETETQEFADLIRTIRNAGISVLLIEHHMSLVMDISDYITVLDYGKKIAEGTPAEISSNPVVQKAYLGEEAEAC